MSEFDYRQKLVDDLLEQFRGKKNISVLVASYARQLQEVYDFLLSLLTVLDLDRCVGRQLDLIGEIVVLTRYDARAALGDEYEGEVLDDDLYRKFLKYKIFRNTSDGTYKSIMRGIKMFWTKTPVYWEQREDVPATILLSTPPLTPEMNPRELIEAPIIRPAGVNLILEATTRSEVDPAEVYIGGAFYYGRIRTELPELQLDYNLTASVKVTPMMWSIMRTTLKEITI